MTMDNEITEQLKSLTVPKVSIVDTKGAPASIDDYDSFMQFLMLASINANLTKMRKLQEDRESEGEMMGFDVAVTDQVEELDFPWDCQSMTLINSSVNPVDVWVNNMGHYPRRMRQNIPLEINFGGHKLKGVSLQCDPGLTANVEIAVKY